ncbi:hypothetical protein ACFE04_029421 [Oxalis oulophora]
MYARRILLGRNQRRLLFQSSKYSIKPECQHHRSLTLVGDNFLCKTSLVRRFCSKGEESESNNTKPINEDKGKIRKEKVIKDVKLSDLHARLGEQDQLEWLSNEKLAIESKKNESPYISRHEKFKNDFLRRIIPWKKIQVSWETFPYYINEHKKNLLVECATSHLKNQEFTCVYGNRLTSSNGRILLQSVPGSELYRERMVRALARDLQVPLLVLDSSVLAPYDFSEDNTLSDNENEEECSSDQSEAENEEDDTSSNDKECSDAEAEEALAEAALKKLVPHSFDEFEKRVSGDCDSSSETPRPEDDGPAVPTHKLRKGDRVKYIGPDVHGERPLIKGQRGVVLEVVMHKVLLALDSDIDGGNKDNENVEDKESAQARVLLINADYFEHDRETQAQDCYIAMQALHEVLQSTQPIIVYFPDFSQWLSRAVPKSNRNEFVRNVHEMFDKILGPVLLICGQNIIETGSSKEKERFTMILPNLGRLAKLPLSLKCLTDGLKSSKRSNDDEIDKLFTNVFSIHPPKEEDQLRIFNKQVEEDGRIVISRSNLIELQKVLDEHRLSCTDLLHLNTDDIILTKQKAEKIIGWAKNHYLSSSLPPSIEGARLCLPRESLEVAIMRLKDLETSRKPSQNLKSVAKDEYETNFISAVVPPGEIGVKFDDIGALEDVKKALNELVILPMQRPELFSHGSLLRPCKGILLFGPPGTGKTLLAKALATEAGANFISITGSTLTSKWFGDAEKLTKALFSFASKLAPVIIFVDEVDSLLGARGGGYEHEATRRMRNEFMAAWDGLRTKDTQRILILGATNRPFDLDDAVIRRLPRRIYVDLPDAENRKKILKIFLAQENVTPNFQFDELAKATEGYSGSDLKNLCIAAAYRPVQELLDEEKKGSNHSATSTLRSLNLDDFIQSKAKVGPSVAYDATSMNELRKWNEQYGEGGSRKKSPFGF